jgi:hypothetical protein
MVLQYKLGKNGNGNEINPIIASMLRLGTRDFKRSFRAGEAAVSGPRRELWALRKTGWLSPEQIAEMNSHLHRLMEIAGASRHGDKLYAFTVLLTPLDRKSIKRAS